MKKTQDTQRTPTESAAESVPAEGFSPRSMVHARKGSWIRVAVLATAGTFALAVPLTWGFGWLSAASPATSASPAPKPTVHHHASATPSTSTSNPTHAITPPGDRSPSSSQPTTPKKTQAPVVKTRPTTTAQAPGTLATIHGTIVNGQLQAMVWVGANPHDLFPVLMMVDTGAIHTMVSGSAWTNMGDTPTGATTTYAGIGGNETVGFWPHVYVFPHDNPSNAILLNATEPGGVYRTPLAADGIIVLLGQDVIDHGTLVQTGTTWSLTYVVQ